MCYLFTFYSAVVNIYKEQGVFIWCFHVKLDLGKAFDSINISIHYLQRTATKEANEIYPVMNIPCIRLWSI